jgi:hypothetical protein
MTDYNHIPARHDAINLRLEEWARYVRVKPQAWIVQPMFRLYRAPKQWESDLHIRIEINTLAAHEIERAVSFLPDKHRTAIRWAYVFSYIPDARIRAELGLTREALAGLIHDGRSMLINRLRERLIEK